MVSQGSVLASLDRQCHLETQVRFLPRLLTLKLIIMPNMSYCRFENTVNDMQDCLNAIEDREVNDLSDYEVKALQHFLELGKVIVDYEDDIEQILEKYE